MNGLSYIPDTPWVYADQLTLQTTHGSPTWLSQTCRVWVYVRDVNRAPIWFGDGGAMTVFETFESRIPRHALENNH